MIGGVCTHPDWVKLLLGLDAGELEVGLDAVELELGLGVCQLVRAQMTVTSCGDKIEQMTGPARL